MQRIGAITSCVLCLVFARPAIAQEDGFLLRIVDVGAGLCTITRVPADDGFRYMVFDAGDQFPFTAGRCVEAAEEVIGNHPVDVLIVCHPDADHIADADDILESFSVRKVIRTGLDSGSAAWDRFDDAVDNEPGVTVLNLADQPLVPGTEIELGDGTLTLVAGWHQWEAEEDGEHTLSNGELRNVISIVARLDYGDRSILFTGDTIGRPIDGDDDICAHAEAEMVRRHAAGEVSLRSNVVIAPHHGGDNGSSSCFVEAAFGTSANRVWPRWVIFAAGHDHHHPRVETVNRYRQFGGIGDGFLFRTDRGDIEEGESHWDAPAPPEPGCEDRPEDDDIEIRITPGGWVSVIYVSPSPGPCR